MFWISLALIVVFMLMAIFPQLFTSKDPTYADLAKARQTPSAEAVVRVRRAGLRRLYAKRLRRPRLGQRWHSGDAVQPGLRMSR